MREGLWPSLPGRHAKDIERYFAGELREPVEVFLAFDDQGEAAGLIELSIRAYAEGCVTDRVAFIEGWFVEPTARGTAWGLPLSPPQNHGLDLKVAWSWGPLPK
jgi:aminoglycoside 6'-N-acetyltransferase I